MNAAADLTVKIQEAPVHPGCYLFKNRQGKIIYIGKAKNIRNRVRSYFVKGQSKAPKTVALVQQAADIEFIITHSEIEALILENTLIKKHRPRFNVFLKDDKTFPYIRITNEPFPQVYITRKIVRDGSKYFGPYTDSRALRDTLRVLKNLFNIRSCSHHLDEASIARQRIKLCLDYHIHKCDGPCQGLISVDTYDQIIQQVKSFLQGRTGELITEFETRMQQAAQSMQFEAAAKLRDNLQLLRHYSNRQVVETTDFNDRDIVCWASDGGTGCVLVLHVRQGKLIARDAFFPEGDLDTAEGEILDRFITQYYDQVDEIPPEICVNIPPDQPALLTAWLTERRGARVDITQPVRSDKARLMKMAEQNAFLEIQSIQLRRNLKPTTNYLPRSLVNLQAALQMPQPPRRIEAFDISNIRGRQAVASMVSFSDARADKKQYRRFRIRTVQGSNDFAMVGEVVHRRYSRLTQEQQDLPDLIIIDGGKGQLKAACDQLQSLGITQPVVIGLAKRLEEIFLPNHDEPFYFGKNDSALLLLKRIRDEAHRFAITYHRKLRRKDQVHSELDTIPGLGAVRKKALWQRFQTISQMRSASLEDLAQTEFIGKKTAELIWIYLHR